MARKEWFYMWFQDGGGHEAIHGRRKLRQLAKRFDFDVYEVVSRGETFFKDEDGNTVGGVFKEVK